MQDGLGRVAQTGAGNGDFWHDIGGEWNNYFALILEDIFMAETSG